MLALALVTAWHLPGANAAHSVFTAAAIILGPGLGGVLLSVSPALVFTINAATFGGSVVCVLAVRSGDALTRPPRDGTPTSSYSLNPAVGHLMIRLTAVIHLRPVWPPDAAKQLSSPAESVRGPHAW
jgi:hypothetical protein